MKAYLIVNGQLLMVNRVHDSACTKYNHFASHGVCDLPRMICVSLLA